MNATTEKMKLTTPSDREIRTERIFNAPPERVWKAMTDPKLVAQWWGRGNKLVVEKFEFERGGHWRFVEHAAEGAQGFEGRFREIKPITRIVQTFEWDGMPGYVSVTTMELQPLPQNRSLMVNVSIFHTTEERDGMLKAGMEGGQSDSYAALDGLLTRM